MVEKIWIIAYDKRFHIVREVSIVSIISENSIGGDRASTIAQWLRPSQVHRVEGRND
jgi:hypothetical protein